MQVDITKLTGGFLDYAVAKIEDELPKSFDDWYQTWPKYSSNWWEGGKMIEKHKIDVIADPNGKEAWCGRIYVDKKEYKQYATTPLVAAMRAYVNSMEGYSIYIPNDLWEKHKGVQ